MTGRITTRILGATTIVGASFFVTLLVTPALPQSAPEPFVPWLMKFFQPRAPVETATLPVPRPRPIQQPPKSAAAAQSNPLTPAVAHSSEQAVRQPPMTHQHEQYSQQQPIPRPREQANQQIPKFLLGPTMVPPDEQLVQPTRVAVPAREQANQQMPKFLLGPTMVSPDEQLIQPTRLAAAGPTTIAARAAVSNGDFDADLRLPRKRIELVAPPYVHAHEQATREGPKIIEVRLVVEEKDMVIDDAGTKIKAMTFNGTIPAPAIIVHEGDYVETTLVNPSTNSMQHNIDFHSATGGLGGGDLTLISPGEQTVLRWKATRPGAYVYHCIPGGSMIPWHIMAGMSGLIMVLPRGGLKDGEGRPLHYDRIYDIGEQAFYVPRGKDGKFKTYASHADAFSDTIELMHGLVPTHVVYNGRVGALTGKNALPAKVGENVLIVHTSTDRDTRVHIVGGHGDYLWEMGKFNNPPTVDAESWFVRAGSASVVLYTFLEPGVYVYINHNMTEGVELGASAHFKVQGPWNNDLMAQVRAPEPIRAAGKALGEQYGFSITGKESLSPK
jgi:nitrite reductase (NO-forming)